MEIRSQETSTFHRKAFIRNYFQAIAQIFTATRQMVRQRRPIVPIDHCRKLAELLVELRNTSGTL